MGLMGSNCSRGSRQRRSERKPVSRVSKGGRVGLAQPLRRPHSKPVRPPEGQQTRNPGRFLGQVMRTTLSSPQGILGRGWSWSGAQDHMDVWLDKSHQPS